MTTFNAGAYLHAQVDSVLVQLEPADELVVSDDGSTDGTYEALLKYRHPGLRVFRSNFRNVSKNFEYVLRQAKGEVIFLADQDDEWRPNKMERMLAALRNCDLVVSDCELVDGVGTLLEKSYFALNRSRPGLAANFRRNSYLGCCMAFRKGILDHALPIPRGVPHDMWIGLIAEVMGKTQFLPEQLIRFRRHEKTASFAGKRSGRSLPTKLYARAHTAWHLAVRWAKIRLGEHGGQLAA